MNALFHPRCHRLVLLPVFLAVICGFFWGPPILFSDTATGLLAWRNHASGGSWNTLALPDPANIANTIEEEVTWWSPGQYIPLGLLVSAGLPLGAAMLLVATAGALSVIAGMMKLARALGAPDEALPWIGIGVAASWHTLYAFGVFNGGELAQAAAWPWIVLAGWHLRTRPVLLVWALPSLLVLGIITKHSFAIYALALVVFLWLEQLRDHKITLGNVTRTTIPFVLAGLLFLIGRWAVLPKDAVVPSDPGQIERNIADAFGFGAFAPLFSATGTGSLLGRIFFSTGLTFEEGWQRISFACVLLSPLPLTFYGWLALGRGPLHRLCGIVALISFAVLFTLMARGGSISLEDRHYRPAGLLMLAVLGAACAGPNPLIVRSARAILCAIVVFGVSAMLQRHHNIHTLAFPSGDHASVTDMPPAALAELRALQRSTAGTDAILYLPSPSLSGALTDGRLLVTDAIDRDLAWINARPHRGRVHLLTLALPAYFEADGRATALRLSFLDYIESDWTRHTVAGWDLWQASTNSSP